jgi:hypothetical protein
MLAALHPATAPPRLTVTVTDLTRALAAVLPHAARTRDLPTLAAVRFETDDRQLLLIATDRYSLAVTTIPVTQGDEQTDTATSALVAVRDGRRLGRLLADSPPGDATLTLHRDQLTIATTGGQLAAPLLDGAYPPWRSLLTARLADHQPPAAGHGYDPALLARFTTAVGKGQPITVRYGADGKPALVLADRFAGMVMPFRHCEPPETAWLNPLPEATAPAAA